MSFFTMVAVIVSALFLTRMIIRIVEAQQNNVSDETLQRMQQLEKRIANIETILTSKDYHLKKAFEDLENQQES